MTEDFRGEDAEVKLPPNTGKLRGINSAFSFIVPRNQGLSPLWLAVEL